MHGWRHPGGTTTATSPRPRPAALQDAFDWLDASTRGGTALPLQVTAAGLRPLTAAVGLQAWRAGSAQLVFSPGTGGRINVHSLVDCNAAQADAQALVAALLAHHPGMLVQVPPLQRAAVGGAALERLGFERVPLHQWWMRRKV